MTMPELLECWGRAGLTTVTRKVIVFLWDENRRLKGQVEDLERRMTALEEKKP